MVQFLKVVVEIGVVEAVTVELIGGVVVDVEADEEAVGEGVALTLTSVVSTLSVFKCPLFPLFRELLLFSSAAAAAYE